MIEGTPRIRENPGATGNLIVGQPITLGTPNSVLIDDSSGNLGLSTPSLANTVLSWNGTNFVWTNVGSGNMAIGNLVTFGTDPSILFLSSGGLLSQDPTEFSFNPQVLFHTQITDGASYNSEISASQGNVALLENNLSNGKSEGLSLDTVRGFNLFGSQGIVSSGINGPSDGTGATVYHYNNFISATTGYTDTSIASIWTDQSVTSSNTLDATQADLRTVNSLGQTAYFNATPSLVTSRLDDTSAGTQSYFEALNDKAFMRFRHTLPATSAGIVSTEDTQTYMNWFDGLGIANDVTLDAIKSRLYYSDSGSGNSSYTNLDGNQFTTIWTTNTGTLAQIFGNLFSTTMEWTNSTVDAIVQATSTRSRIYYDNGTGNVAQGIFKAANYDLTYSDVNGYTSESLGDASKIYNSYTTPYQIYSDESFTFSPGDTLTDDAGNTADVISDDGNGLIVATNVNIITPPAFYAGSNITNQDFNVAIATADAGVYEAEHAVRQNDAPGMDRYADFIHTITSSSITDKYEIKHPLQMSFNVPSLVSSNSQFNFSYNINSTVAHQFSNTNSGSAAALHFNLYNGTSQFLIGIVGNNNSSYGGLYTQNTARFENTIGNIVYDVRTSGTRHIFAANGSTTASEIATIAEAGVGISGSSSTKITAPTAYLELAAGTTSASTAPLKFNSGSLMTSAEAGAVEFLTDKWYGTITTGTARKEITLNESALTSGQVPIATTNGRLQNGFVFTQGSYTPTASNTSNITAVTPLVTYYTRMGNMVFFEGQVVIDPTTTVTFTSFELSLPIASNFGAATDAGGTGYSGNVQEGFQILSSAANDTLVVWMTPINVTSQTYSFSGSYQVI